MLAWLNQQQCAITDLVRRSTSLSSSGSWRTGRLELARRQVFARMVETGKPPATIVEEEGLAQVRDTGQLEVWVDEVIAAHPAEAERYRAGEQKLLGFFMGQVMRKSAGKADPRQATEIIRRKLGG